MTQERYDIEIHDKIDPQINAKLNAIATDATKAHSAVQKLQASLKAINSSPINKLNKELQANEIATARMQKEMANAQKASVQLGIQQAKLATETIKNQLASEKLAQSHEKSAGAAKNMADAHVKAFEAISKLRAAQNADGAQAAFNQRLGVRPATPGAAMQSATVFENGFRESEQLAARVNALRAATDPLYVVQTNFNRSMKEANELLAKGAITHDQHAKAVQVLTRNYEQATKTAQTFGQSAKFTRNQLLTVQYTVNDIAASLASGTSPFVILMQQGGQVTQAFGGLRGTLGALSSVFTPLRLLIGGVALTVGILAKAFLDANNEAVKLENTIRITNGYAGVTQESFKGMASEVASFANESVSSARNVLMQLTASGRFQSQQIQELGASALLMARYTDQSADDVIKSFVKMADGPAAYAKQLNSQFHFLTSAQIAHIRELEETGRKTEAIAALSKNMYDWLGKQGPANLGYLERAWHNVSKSISDAWTKLKSFGQLSGPTERLAKLKAELAELQTPVTMRFEKERVTYTPIATERGKKRAEELRKEIAHQQALVDKASAQTKAQERLATIQTEGASASERLSNNWATFADNTVRAKREVEAFRNDLEKALKADPNDKAALQAKANQAIIEKGINDRYMPKTAKANTANAKLAEKREDAISKITRELDAQVRSYGMLAEARDVQQKMDQIENGLADKKITLSQSERDSIRAKVQAINENKIAQDALDRVYEGATGPLREYNATQAAASKLLKDGAITAEQFARTLRVAQQQYEDATNPMARIRRELDEQIKLMELAGPAQAVMSRAKQIENQLLERGIVLSQQDRAELISKLALIERVTAANQALQAVYDSVVGKQVALGDAIKATNQAFADGIINADAYKIRINELGKEALALKIELQTANFDDVMLASLSRVTDGYNGVLSGLNDSFSNFFMNVTDGFANTIGQSIMAGESIREALGNAARNAVGSLISSLIKLGIQYVLNATLGQSLAAAATAASAAQAGLVAAAWATPAALVSLASYGANSAPAMAGITATTTLANALALAGIAGFKDGGYTGNVGRDEIAGVVHGEEFVVTAEATRRNRPMLEAMNRGIDAPTARSGASAPPSSAPAAPTPGTRIINVLSPDLFEDFVDSPSGEKVIINMLRRNNIVGTK